MTLLAPARADALLADGAVVTLRPVTAADRDELTGMYATASPEALRARFLGFSRSAAEADVARLVRPADDDHFAVAAVDRGRIQGVGGWERSGPDSAEVAVLVREGGHGRGVGTLLVEEIAADAAGRGIRRLAADVLGENREVLALVRDLGSQPVASSQSGIVHLEFELSPDARWWRHLADREATAEHASLHRILAPRSIAVVGAGSHDGLGRRILRQLVQGGFDGELYAVNRSGAPVLGVPAARSLVELGQPVDVAIVAVPAGSVLAVAEQAAHCGVYGLVVISDGFAETGAEGARRQEALVQLVRQSGMRLVGPNCLGYIATGEGRSVYATFTDTRPLPGGVALVSQSGGVGLALLDTAVRRRLGVSCFVSIGNAPDVNAVDLLLHLADDPATRVCALYVESLGEGRRLAAAARRAARIKPVVAVAAGRSVAGARGARSHTAAAATPEVAVDALFRDAGIIRASTLSELVDTVALLAAAPLPRGPRVAVVTNSGGPGILAADACAAAGLELPPLSAATQRALGARLERPAALTNPVDTTAGAAPEELAGCARVLLDCDEVDAVLLVHTHLTAGDVTAVAAAARDLAAAGLDKPLVTVFIGHEGVPEPLSAGSGPAPVPVFSYPETAARALGAAAAYAGWRSRPLAEPPELEGIDVDAVRRRVATVLAAAPEGRWLDTDEAIGLVQAYGVPVAASERADSPVQALRAARRLGLPVAVKAAAGTLLHRTERGAVRLGLTSLVQVREAYAAVRSATGCPAVVVQQMAPRGVETAVGMLHDPAVGPMVMLALGGVATDLLADRAFRLPPLSRQDVHEQVLSLRAAPLLFGYRGSAPSDVAALEDVLLRVAQLALDVPEVVELDLNPVIVTPIGALAVDVKVRIDPAPGAPIAFRRLSPALG